MKTKIVYCIVSNEEDIYLEQAWVSIYTLRKYNPDADVILLVDKGTETTLTGKRAGIRELVTEVVAVDAPDGYNAMQRSRYLKTNFRQFITGDLLFIDADTVIGGSLAGIDNIDAEIACVPDGHRSIFELHAINAFDYAKEQISRAFDIQEIDSEFYFNSGVIYVKDTPRMHTFFTEWFEAWKYSAFERKISIDQPALFVVNKKNGYLIKKLSGEYNCQIAFSLKYFYGGLILHFFTSPVNITSDEISVFYDQSFYMKLKEYGGVKRDVKEILDNKSRWFNVQTNIIDSSHLVFMCNYVGKNIYKSYIENTMFYRLNERFCAYRFMINNFIKILKHKFS